MHFATLQLKSGSSLALSPPTQSMAKPSSAADSYGTSSFKAVFIDTSLHTHLAMIVSDSDTVSDFKKKILYEHPLCFPNIGEIKIHALKVKRKGYLYHLSDSMFVKSAFDGVSEGWFLFVDASSIEEHTENQHSHDPDSGKLVACFGIMNNPSVDGINLLPDDPSKKLSNIDVSSLPQEGSDWHVKPKPIADQFGTGDSDGEVLKDLEMEVEHTVDGHCKVSFPDANKSSDPKIEEKYDLRSKEYEFPGMHAGCKEDSIRNGISNVQCNVLLEGTSKTGSVAKRKHKTKRKNEDAAHDSALKEKNVSTHEFGASQQGTLVPEDSSGTAGSVVPYDIKMGNKNIADRLCRSSSSDTNKRLGTDVSLTNVLCKETVVPEKHVEYDNENAKNDAGDVLCDKSLEEASQARPASKKKRKTENKGGNTDSLKENKALLCDPIKGNSGPEVTISQHSLEDKQKNTDATFDILSIDGKRKRKKKSSKLHNEVAASVPSSEKDVPGQSAQGAMIAEPCKVSLKEKHCDAVQEVGRDDKILSPRDIDMRSSDTGNVENKNDAPELAAESSVKRMRISKDHHAIDVEGRPPLAVLESNGIQKYVGVSGHDGILVKNSDSFRTDPTGRFEGQRELSQNNDPKAVPLECQPSNRDEIYMDPKVVVTSNLLDTKRVVEPGKSSKKRKKSRKHLDPVGGTSVISGAEHIEVPTSGISSNEAHKAANGDHSSDKARKKESISSPIEGKEVSKNKTPPNRETDDVIRNVLESLQQISQDSSNAENMDVKLRKKTKKKQSSTEKNFLELRRKDEDAACKDPILSTDNAREVDVSSKLTKKTNLMNTSSMNQLHGSNLEPENNSGVEINAPHTQLISGIVQSSQVTSHKFEGNNAGRPLQDVLSVNPPDDANISVPSQQQHADAASGKMLVDKLSDAKGTVNELKAKKNRKKLDVHFDGPSSDLESSVKLNENRESGGKSHAGNSSSIQLQSSLSKDESDSLMLHPNKVLPEASGSGTKAPPSSKSGKLNSTHQEAQKHNVVNASGTITHSEKNREDYAALNSSLESSKNIIYQNRRDNKQPSHVDRNHVAVRKASANNIGEVVNSSEHKKSLLAKSGTIFKDDSTENSEDDGVDNSDASTRTPSYNSLSSDYSDGDSYTNINSPRNGSYGSKGKEGGERNITKSYSSGRKSMTLDTILRSSSRYKKAKLTASQSQQEDTESQPVDFVPDS